MTNIFTISPRMPEEDRFTSFLHYVVDCNPVIGQAISDYILTSGGLAPSRFIRAIDHPSGTVEDRPDFLLECDGVDIVCEHKIDSPLGKRQLERYLELPRSKPFFVALISNGICDVPKAVVNHERYVRPLDTDISHFCWQSIYPLIVAEENRLVTDFLEYMRSLSMKPINCESWHGLFDHKAIAEAFGQQWYEVIGCFKAKGASCRRDPGKLGLQIQYPNDWLHLLYVFVSPAAKPRQDSISGPYLAARLFTKKNTYPNLSIGESNQEFETNVGDIYFRAREGKASWDSNLALVSDYHTSLDGILTDNMDLLKRRLRDFSLAVFSHASESVQGI